MKPIFLNSVRFAGLLFFFLLLGCGPPSDQPVLGSVFQIEGSATITSSAGSGKTRALSRDEKLSAGDEIRFQGESVAVLCLTPGIYLSCFGETDIRIEQLSISKDGDETGNAMNTRRATIRLEKGRVHVFLPPAGPSRANLRIDSPHGMLNTKTGSLISISLTDDSTRILCARGELNWSESASGSTNIGAGYFSDRKTGASGATDPVSAADDGAAQGEIMALLDSAQAIADLENAARSASAPWRRP